MSNTIFSTDTKRVSKKSGSGSRGEERSVFEEKDTQMTRDNRDWDVADTCPRPCPPPPCQEEVYLQKVRKVPQCDPCGGYGGYGNGRRGWGIFWSGIVVAIILGIGFWIIKPDWVLKKGPCGEVIDPCCIDWLKLIIWAIVATIIIYIILWILAVLFGGFGGGYGGGGWGGGYGGGGWGGGGGYGRWY